MKYDEDKIDEYTLALLYLVSYERHEGAGARAWKGFDWETLKRLHDRGYDKKTVGWRRLPAFRIMTRNSIATTVMLHPVTHAMRWTKRECCHTARDVHGDKLECKACHIRRVVSCTNCHIDTIVNEKKRVDIKLPDWVIYN